MKTYIEKNFDINYLKNIDLQQVGVYYNVPIKDIFEDKRVEFEDEIEDFENDTILLNKYSIDSGEYVENYGNISYDYTDEDEIEDTFKQLMNYKQYNHYLVVLFNSTWTNASGYKFFDDYMECFYRDYDSIMYIFGSSRNGKYLELFEYHHDKPMGHSSIIIGLTDTEYEKLSKKGIDEIIDFGEKSLRKVELLWNKGDEDDE